MKTIFDFFQSRLVNNRNANTTTILIHYASNRNTQFCGGGVRCLIIVFYASKENLGTQIYFGPCKDCLDLGFVSIVECIRVR